MKQRLGKNHEYSNKSQAEEGEVKPRSSILPVDPANDEPSMGSKTMLQSSLGSVGIGTCGSDISMGVLTERVESSNSQRTAGTEPSMVTMTMSEEQT